MFKVRGMKVKNKKIKKYINKHHWPKKFIRMQRKFAEFKVEKCSSICP